MDFNNKLFWGLSILFLSLLSLMTGLVNIFPTVEDSFCRAFNFSDKNGKLLLRTAMTILFVILPTGIFMDKFGSDITLGISVLITILSITSCLLFSKIQFVFSTSYLLASFGCCSIFISCLEIVLTRSPKSIQGLSTSFVCGSLSLSFGLLLEVFKLGKKIFKHNDEIHGFIIGFRTVCIFVCFIIIISYPLAYIFYRKFSKKEKEILSDENESKTKLHELIFSLKYVIIIFAMYNIATDGLIVLTSGQIIWKSYGKNGYPDSAAKWGFLFSILNTVFTIILSFFIDLLYQNLKQKREKLFGYIWGALGIIPILTSIFFRATDNEILFGIFMSLLGIPFGFGLSQIPGILFTAFGTKYYGLLLGIIQISPIFSSFTTAYILGSLGKTGKMIFIFILGALHPLFGFLFNIFF